MCRVVDKYQVGTGTHTFKLEAMRGKDIHHFKHWYDDLDFCGRHFLLYSKKHPLVKRQYTICCSIVPKVYTELIELCQNFETNRNFPRHLLDSEDTNSVFITCKDYMTKKGVAS